MPPLPRSSMDVHDDNDPTTNLMAGDLHSGNRSTRPERWQANPYRRIASPAVLAAFFVTFLWLGVSYDYSFDALDETSRALSDTLDAAMAHPQKRPDFGQYVTLRSLSEQDLAHDDRLKRLIVVGDIHGMEDPFEKLLEKADYDPSHDYLAHLGDIVAKGPRSMQVLGRFAAQNVTGVRGNHDQKVIEWRGFMEWVKEQKGGEAWWDEMVALDLSPKAYKKLRKHKKKFPVPKDWEWGGDHWKIAKKMTVAEYDYLRNLPLAIHVPHMHTYLVHGGILPSDPTRDIHDRRQPLAHLPTLLRASKDVDVIREAQERSILSDVPQNTDPWTLLNVRDITKKGKVSRKGGDGTPWAELWNQVQSLCSGFDYSGTGADGGSPVGPVNPADVEEMKKKKLPCYATSVIYGHAASRGLDIKRWSVGIDTGCVYGRQLTALIFGDPHHKGVDEAGGEDELEEMRFGDSSKARLVSVKCHASKA